MTWVGWTLFDFPARMKPEGWFSGQPGNVECRVCMVPESGPDIGGRGMGEYSTSGLPYAPCADEGSRLPVNEEETHMTTDEYQALVNAANEGDADRQAELAARLATGDGVDKNLRQAVRWYTAAAWQDHEDATYNLALMYLYGEGVEQDSAKSIELLNTAAELGSSDAHMFLGTFYESGECGLAIDYLQAAEHYLKAAVSSIRRDKRGIHRIGELLQDRLVNSDSLCRLMLGASL